MKKYNIKYTDEDRKYNWWLTDVMAINEKEAIKQAKFKLRDVIGLHIIKYQLTK